MVRMKTKFVWLVLVLVCALPVFSQDRRGGFGDREPQRCEERQRGEDCTPDHGQRPIQIATKLQVTTQSVPTATEGKTYMATIQATGGRKPYKWSITSGSLPRGLALQTVNDTGVISGVPKLSTRNPQKTFTFTIEVTDSAKTFALVAVRQENSEE